MRLKIFILYVCINVIWRYNEGVEIEDANDGYNITTSLNGPGVSQREGDSVESGVTTL